jgi:hypothetical protein
LSIGFFGALDFSNDAADDDDEAAELDPAVTSDSSHM